MSRPTPTLGIVLLSLAGLLCGCAALPPPVADRLDPGDIAAIRAATQTALETAKLGEGVAWANAQSGHRGTVTPLRTVETAGEPPCRDYQITAAAGDETALGYETACRRANGVWVNEHWDDPADVLRASARKARDARYDDRWPYDPWYDDPWRRWPYRDPWCRWPRRSGVSIGVGTGF